jgi:very-short-patch-repair endonuclease
MMREFARRLRRNPSEAERKSWTMLRYRQFHGARFRRQQRIGNYIVDFFCPSAKLIIELDGGQHNTNAGIARYETRDAWLAARGYRIIRFWNDDVLKNSSVVLGIIAKALAPPPEAPTRLGLPLKGGG